MKCIKPELWSKVRSNKSFCLWQSLSSVESIFCSCYCKKPVSNHESQINQIQVTYRVYLPYRYNSAYLHFDKFQCPPSCVHPCIEPNSHQQVDHIAAYTQVLEFLANFGDRPAYIETTNWTIFEICQLIGYWPGMKMLHQLLQYERRSICRLVENISILHGEPNSRLSGKSHMGHHFHSTCFVCLDLQSYWGRFRPNQQMEHCSRLLVYILKLPY